MIYNLRTSPADSIRLWIGRDQSADGDAGVGHSKLDANLLSLFFSLQAQNNRISNRSYNLNIAI